MSIRSDASTEFSSWDIPVTPTPGDRRILRDLAGTVADAAAAPLNDELAALWQRHNALTQTRPLVLVRPENGWTELVPESLLQCQDPRLREWEMVLRRHLFRHRHIPDDWPLPRHFDISWVMKWGDYGMEPKIRPATVAGGAFAWDPPLKNIEDMQQLHFRDIAVDRQCTAYKVTLANELFGDLLPARVRGRLFVMLGMAEQLAYLRGIEQTMMDLFDNPELLHEAMTFLRDAKLHELDFYEKEGLLTLNNEAYDHIAQGGLGIIDELPAGDFTGTVRLCDLWGTEASQEFSGVGPDQFNEFLLQYQAPVLERFGLVSYGCCEPLDNNLEALLRHLPNLRRVSVSAWCDRARAAEKLTDKYLYAYKPNPALICGPQAHLEAAEEQLRETIDMTKDCHLELIMKDTHTFQKEPQRITQWTEMATRLARERG
ncbi:MAG: hypothetical protein QGF67_07515 [Lentisphaeria bacterium]|jgi:hypothetical protein|nr:hypothetical protein [Lentisphaeria bacterium]MDP7741271.1 hypothetical protein [Lentisphaeria bacterium]